MSERGSEISSGRKGKVMGARRHGVHAKEAIRVYYRTCSQQRPVKWQTDEKDRLEIIRRQRAVFPAPSVATTETTLWVGLEVPLPSQLVNRQKKRQRRTRVETVNYGMLLGNNDPSISVHPDFQSTSKPRLQDPATVAHLSNRSTIGLPDREWEGREKAEKTRRKSELEGRQRKLGGEMMSQK